MSISSSKKTTEAPQIAPNWKASTDFLETLENGKVIRDKLS